MRNRYSLPARSPKAFTLAELLIAMGLAAIISLGLITFSFVSTRLMARNLGVNHSNEAVRLANAQLSRDLHASYSNFTLVDSSSGTELTDVTPEPSAVTDPTTGLVLSTHAAGVRFRTLAGGPYRLTKNASVTATSLTFTLSGDGSYRPLEGDKIYFPLVRRELEITAVSTMPTSDTSSFTVTTSAPLNHEFLDVSNQVTVAYFLRKVGYSVYSNQLRFHRRIPAQAPADVTVLRDGITNPKPFALLCGTTGEADPTRIRVSLESYDRKYSAQRFQSGAVTLQNMLVARTSPTLLVQTN